MKLTVNDAGTEIVMYFTYDASGTPTSILYDGTTYYYVTNLQGDVVGIVNQNGNIRVSYTYDAWGNILSVTGANAATIGRLNPLRYRGYVYDQPTGLYYLQSRYYAPNLGRFLNADALVSTGQGLLGNNMFAYCKNNPIIYADNAGFIPCHAMMCHVDGVNRVVDEGVRWQMRDKQKSAKDWLLENISTYGNVNAENGKKYYYIWFTLEEGVGYSKNCGKEKTINFFGSLTAWDISGGVKINGNGFGMSAEIGSDVSIGLHFDNSNIDFGTNGQGRGYIQYTISDNDLYAYQKFSFNVPEIVGTVLVVIYAPELLPYIVESFSVLSTVQA